MMMPAPPALAASPYTAASGVTTPTLHPAMPQLDAAYAAAAAANLQPPAKDTTWTKLFVGGLPYTTTDQELKEFFEEFGEIEEAAVIIDRQTGKSKGYGFVTMADTKAAARAVQNPNPVIQGRKSNVNYAFIGAKHNYHSNRGTAAASVAVSSGDEQSLYALMSPEAYATAATATTMRYAAFLPPQYGAANTPAGAGAMMYTPASPYNAMMPTAMPIPTATAASQGQPMLAGAYPTAAAYDYGGLAVSSSGAGATTTLPPQYFYPQVIDPSQYMAMASLQGTHLTTAAAPGSAGTMMPSMYQSLVPSSGSVSGAVTSVSAALPSAAAPALSAGSYPAIQEQR